MIIWRPLHYEMQNNHEMQNDHSKWRKKRITSDGVGHERRT